MQPRRLYTKTGTRFTIRSAGPKT